MLPTPASTSTWASAGRQKAYWRRRRCAASAGKSRAGSGLDPKKKGGGARKRGIRDPRKKYGISDLVKGDCLFAATGVTSGALLDGVRVRKDVIETETVVM